MSSPRPPTHLVPENRYDLLPDGQVWDPSIAIVIPAYNHPDRLDLVLRGLAAQTRPADEVVVADDGSEADLRAVVERHGELPVRYARQDRDGFGAGRARNLGVAHTASDVIVFIDADCIPRSDLVEAHLAWHRRSAGLVTVGERIHVPAASIASVSDQYLESRAAMVPAAPRQWRTGFFETNRAMRTGDDGFRSFVTSNLGIDRRAFEQAGGFSESFTAWGGEDTELGWRTWNNGAVFALADAAVVFHLLGEDEDPGAKEATRRLQRIGLADAIPHRFYRPPGGGFYSVPSLSWIVVADSTDETLAAWAAISRSTVGDAELIVVGPEAACEPLRTVASGTGIVGLPGARFEDAVLASRGEFIGVVDGRVAVNPNAAARAVGLMRESPRLGHVRGALVDSNGVTARSADDLAAVHDHQARRGMPLLLFVRRRELMKDIGHDGRLDWGRIQARSRQGMAFEASEFDDVQTVIGQPSRLTLDDVRSAGLTQSWEAAKKLVRRRARG